jgi:formylglycine-generating enzyme required for sulfatase activity
VSEPAALNTHDRIGTVSQAARQELRLRRAKPHQRALLKRRRPGGDRCWGIPAGASVFGVEDLVGNAPEWVVLVGGVDLNEPELVFDDNTGSLHVRGHAAISSEPGFYTCDYRGPWRPPTPVTRACFRVCTSSRVRVATATAV